MTKTCKNCFHCRACSAADSKGYIPGEDFDVGETCSEYICEEDVIVESRTGQFKHLTDEVFGLFTSFQESGFNKEAAYELTKGYLEVAFERNAEWLRAKEHRKAAKVSRPYK